MTALDPRCVPSLRLLYTVHPPLATSPTPGQVFVRIRPSVTPGAPAPKGASAADLARENCVHATSRHSIAIAPPEGSQAYKSGDRGQTYSFTRVFDRDTPQDEYYEATAAPLVGAGRGAGGVQRPQGARLACSPQGQACSTPCKGCGGGVAQGRGKARRRHLVKLPLFIKPSGHTPTPGHPPLPQVRDLLRNPSHNSVMLAYGITAAGKTYTIEGTREQPGVLPRALTALFQGLQSHVEPVMARAAYYEVRVWQGTGGGGGGGGRGGRGQPLCHSRGGVGHGRGSWRLHSL